MKIYTCTTMLKVKGLKNILDFSRVSVPTLLDTSVKGCSHCLVRKPLKCTLWKARSWFIFGHYVWTCFSPIFLVAVSYHIVRVKSDPAVRRGDRVALCTPIILCPTLPMSAPHPLPLVVFGNPLPNRFISGVTETLPTHPQQTAGQKQQTVSCLNKSGGRFGETAPSSGYGYTACTDAHGFAQGFCILMQCAKTLLLEQEWADIEKSHPTPNPSIVDVEFQASSDSLTNTHGAAIWMTLERCGCLLL